MRLSRPVFSWLMLLALGGCAHATIRKAPSLETAPPRTVAVLPPDPGAAPVEVVPFVRNLLHVELSRRGYQCLPIEQVDSAARSGAAPAEIAAALNADAVLYTAVTRYALERSLLNTRTTFGAMFTLMDSAGGELWVAALEGVADSGGQDDGQHHHHNLPAAVIGMAIDAANAAAAAERPPFGEVAASVVRTCVNELPKGPLAR